MYQKNIDDLKSVEGYTSQYNWHKYPVVTEEYYKEHIKGKCIRLIHFLDFEERSWDWEEN